LVQVSTQEPGTVIGQAPAAGTQAQQTSAVTVTVAQAAPTPTPGAGQVTVPNVIGLTRAAAVAAIEQAGLEPVVLHEAECDPAEAGCDFTTGIVWSESPAGGTAADRGSAFVLAINP
jgi:beta-lactam-binding protein with PASTA domain